MCVSSSLGERQPFGETKIALYRSHVTFDVPVGIGKDQIYKPVIIYVKLVDHLDSAPGVYMKIVAAVIKATLYEVLEASMYLRVFAMLLHAADLPFRSARL